MATRIGNFLKQRREELELSRDDIALDMPIEASTIGQIERGEIEVPSIPVLEAFAHVLRISMRTLENLLPNEAVPRENIARNKNFELLATGQIEIMHNQVHARLDVGDDDCDNLRSQHDSLASELVKRGVLHDTEIICPESELAQKAPNYRRGFTDDTCTSCAFGQLFPFCNLYKEDYTKGYTCDSFRYFEVLNLEPPHGFLMASGKQTAIANDSLLDSDKIRIIVSDDEVFGIAELEEPVQMKVKEFDTEEWLNQHRVTKRERRQWWPESEMFYVYRLKNWMPYDDGIKLYKNGHIVNEPKLTSDQWRIVSKAKDLPKQIILKPDVVNVTDKQEFIIDSVADCDRLKKILVSAYETDVKDAESVKELIPIYSLALVRNPRMRVEKVTEDDKNEAEAETEVEEKQEGETMPFRIRKREEEYCVVKVNPDDSDGDTMGCHSTEAEAEAQLTALNINVVAEEEGAATHHEKPRKRKKEIEPSGFVENLRKLGEKIAKFLRFAEEDTKLFMNDTGIVQKAVNGELWHFTWSTNAFEDREGEIFSTQALEDYVSANEVNENKGFFNLWHINERDGNFNTDFAVKKWQGVIGRFLVEAGPYSKDKKGIMASNFFASFPDGHSEIAPEGWGCSPEYKYLPEERKTGVYQTIWITRTSTLPRFEAANIWTETRQLKRGNIVASEKQMNAAIQIFGQEFVDEMLAEGQSKTTELESAGVAHKSNEPNVVEFDEKQFELLAQEVAKQFNIENITDTLVVIAGGMKKLQERLEELEKKEDAKERGEMPAFTFNLTRASDSGKTVVTDDDKLKDQKPEESQKPKDARTITPAEFFGKV